MQWTVVSAAHSAMLTHGSSSTHNVTPLSSTGLHFTTLIGICSFGNRSCDVLVIKKIYVVLVKYLNILVDLHFRVVYNEGLNFYITDNHNNISYQINDHLCN